MSRQRRSSIVVSRRPRLLAMTCAIGMALLFPCATRADPKAAATAPRLEHVTFADDKGQKQTADCQVLVEAADGGLLLMERGGRLRTIEKEQLHSRDTTDRPFEPLSPAELGDVLRAELGAGFDVVATRHYVICTNAGKPYAQWCGSLFERLFNAFQNYWEQRKLPLQKPEFPLVAILFADERQFAAFATKDAGPDTATAKGYFNINTNRMVLFDLTGGKAGRGGDFSQVGDVPFNIATVIHEATHQIAFNTGMHTRYADNPLWLTEGMAMFFETPDLTSKSGWKTVGAVNTLRLRQFEDFIGKRRTRKSLQELIETDARFTDAEKAADAYAEAWALNYFLIKTRKEAYVEYLKILGKKPRLKWDAAPERVTDFRSAFGNNLDGLEEDWLRFMRKTGAKN